tara:strand:+ start:25542 stop:26297 length:756 start_codon:yes stop_codon:yes gene_type:complete
MIRIERLVALIALLLFALAPAQAETRWTLVKAYPHDSTAFTEGLFFLDGTLYESTGQYGESEIRQVRLEDGKVLRSVALAGVYFGEGVVNWGDALVSLTWRNNLAFRWDRATLRQTGSFVYPGEGWGLTQDGTRLIMSDGTADLRFLDPDTLAETGRITVTWEGKPVKMLNELEYVKDEILANIWMTNRIARIDPKSGKVIDWIDLGRLVRTLGLTDADAVPNGIAYDAKRDRLFVTGKYWPKLYEIRLKR